MAAAIKALNARIRSNPYTDYLCSTHFWGPASNFGIPIAAIMDTQKDVEYVSGPMTAALLGYASVFMRYALAVTPKNYLLFGCHFVNFGAQSTQAYRYVNHYYLGGKQKALEQKAKDGLSSVEGGLKKAGSKVEGAVDDAASKAKDLASQAKAQVEKATR